MKNTAAGIGKALVIVLLLLYPVIVYFSLDSIGIKGVSLLLAAGVSARLLLNKHRLKQIPWLLPASVLVLVVLFFGLLSGSELGFRLYPVLINLSLLLSFTYSLYRPPSVIETLARLREPELDQAGVRYTAKVTQVWCVFFLLNGCAALYTSYFTAIEIWSLYNGLIAYILMGILMGGEILIRKRVRARNAAC